jgi:hypothetical protein
VHIDHGREFNISFKGTPPGKLVSKHHISGEFTVLGVFEGPTPASGTGPWGKAFQAMDDFITPLKPVVPEKPLFDLPGMFRLPLFNIPGLFDLRRSAAANPIGSAG